MFKTRLGYNVTHPTKLSNHSRHLNPAVDLTKVDGNLRYFTSLNTLATRSKQDISHLLLDYSH
jgi:hypothetical protein